MELTQVIGGSYTDIIITLQFLLSTSFMLGSHFYESMNELPRKNYGLNVYPCKKGVTLNAKDPGGNNL